MKAHNITLIMACLFTVAACAVLAAGAHVVIAAVLAADAIASLILSALYAPAAEAGQVQPARPVYPPVRPAESKPPSPYDVLKENHR